MALTVTEAFSVQSPNGNSLAVFIEAQSGEIKLKDVNGQVESFTDYVTASPYRYNASVSTAIEPILGANQSSGSFSAIGGGQSNLATGSRAYVGGGNCNLASGGFSFLGGGDRNKSCGNTSSVSGGTCNIASGLDSAIGGGASNISSCNQSTVGGGASNVSSCFNSTVSGGEFGTASASSAVVGGGSSNVSSGIQSTVSGGFCNTSSATHSGISGGAYNTSSGLRSSILGGRNNNTASFADAMIVGSCLTATQACTTFVNCLSANNLTQNCYVKVGANKVLENSPFAPSTKSVGSFFDTTTQSALLINSPTKMTLNTTDISNNVSVVGGTAITVANAGIYNLQFSAQLFRASGGTTKRIDIWLRKNGTNVPSSDTVLVFSSSDRYEVAAWNFVVDLAAGGNVELMYSVEDLDIKIQSAPENLVVPHPAVPSLIVTMIEV